jgi:hypothetical protein
LDVLVGYSGFVGSNLALTHKFDGCFNSKNIKDAFELDSDLCIYAGVRAEKYLAAADPKSDFAVIENAIENIKKIAAKQLVLISTIDVYPNPVDVDEDSPIDCVKAHPYGEHRYYLEQWVRENCDKHLIVRLPALFGNNLKKNFIYDLIHIIPSMLNSEKFNEFAERESMITDFYIKQDNGFYKCKQLSVEETKKLKTAFEQIGFTSLNFTDSRASFQFYNLSNLWGHIETALNNNIQLINLAVQPLSVKEIYSAVRGGEFKNETSANVVRYDFKSRYAELLGGSGGYIIKKEKVLDEICKFVTKAER